MSILFESFLREMKVRATGGCCDPEYEFQNPAYSCKCCLRDHVLRKDRSGSAPGAQTALDQGAVALESGFLFDESAHFRSAAAHGLRKRAVPEPVGMLEPGHGHVHDRGRSLHASVRILRRADGKAIRAGGRRAAARGRGGAADEIETRRYHRRRARRSRRTAGPIISRGRLPRFAKWIRRSSSKFWCPIFMRSDWCIQIVLDAGPDIYNHNMETVERLTPLVRSRAKYRTSLRSACSAPKNFRRES